MEVSLIFRPKHEAVLQADYGMAQRYPFRDSTFLDVITSEKKCNVC